MNSNKRDIRSLDKGELKAFFTSSDMPAFRGDQVYEWLWKKGVKEFEAMTNLPKDLRKLLSDTFTFHTTQTTHEQHSHDGTVKNALQLYDGLVIESVLIPQSPRMTACVSSQVGCAMGCNFCATATLKKQRNLTAGEIYDQVVAIHHQAKSLYNNPLTNIVFMGMGEPLLNYEEVMRAIRIITSPEGLGMSPKRITLSTVGIPKMIRRMADDGAKFNLAVSLHSARNEIRSKMMPVNIKNNLDELLKSLKYWHGKTGNRITFEYIVWEGINDTRQDIDALINYCKKVPAKVNLIPYNPVEVYDLKAANEDVLELYRNALQEEGIIVMKRESRGKDIDAACGQLANKSMNNQ